MKREPSRTGAGPVHAQRLWGVVLPTAFLILAFVVPAGGAQHSGALSGRVTNSQGQPQKVLVHLLADGDIPAGDAYSDSNGTYVFMGLPGGTYTVVVQVEGYKPFRETVRLDENIQPRARLMVVLEPAAKRATSAGPAIIGSSSYKLDSHHPHPPFDPNAVKEFDQGNEERDKGNHRAALKHYQKALRIDAHLYPALNNMGALLEKQGHHARAREAFLKAVEVYPDDGEAYINLGHVLYEEGQFRAAIDRLNQGLQYAPQSAAGFFLLGSVYYKLHETEKAEPLLKEACRLAPQRMAPAHLQLANLYLQRHDYGAARIELQTYIEMNPSDPQAPAIKQTLAALAGADRK